MSKKSEITTPIEFDAWLEESDESAVADAAERAELEAKKRELKDGPNLSLSKGDVNKLQKYQRYIITSAMNNVEVYPDFWRSILRYAKETKAKIIVAPIRYRNPTSIEEYKIDGPGWWWPEEVQPYLAGSLIKLHKRLWFLGDLKIQATAANPLSGLDYLGKGASTVFGHSQVAMRTVPTPQYDLPKCMMTTGTCSQPNYSESKAGAKAIFNHEVGALIVEKDRRSFHFRHVLADSEGGFYDLDTYYHGSGIKKKQKATALILGDTHVWWADKKVRDATFDNKSSMVNVLKPETIVHHDLIDAYSVSHHHRKNPITQIAKLRGKMNSLHKEFADVVKYLEATTPKYSDLVIVGSNHQDHIAKYILETDWRQDPVNADIYLELATIMVNNAKMTKSGASTEDPFSSWLEKRLSSHLINRTTFLAREVSYRIAGIELCLHGDMGPNGSRGSIKSLSRIGTKVVIGHSHTPGIEKGAYQVGTSTSLQLEYNRNAPSSWLNTHCVIYKNGKRSLLNVVNGKWRSK